MNAQSLILSLMSAYATESKVETCEIVLSKLKEFQKDNVLPRRMLRRAIKAQENLMKDLSK